MKILLSSMALVAVLAGCTAGTPKSTASAPAGGAPAATATPTTAPAYELPATQNACAPEPVRFISASGIPTYRVKDCTKDEYDYFPERYKASVDAMVAQCKAKCASQQK